MIRQCARLAPFVAAWTMLVTQVLAAPPDLVARAQAIVAQLGAREFGKVEAEFNDTMKAALPAGRIEAVWTNVVSQAGALRRSGGTRTQTSGAFQIVIVTCEFERATLDLHVVFDAAGKVGGLTLRPASAPPPPYTAPSYVTPSAFEERDQASGPCRGR
jgi:hypothetical protein